MDLLELEDAVPPPNIGSVFLEEEGEEESPREEDDVVWTPFLGPNPMTEVEFLFEDLFLVEVSHVVIEPLQQVLGSTVDAYKWTLVRHLDEVFRFKLLKRHFQFQLIYHAWFNLAESLIQFRLLRRSWNRFQERTRLSRYCLRLKLNPGITPTNCGRPWEPQMQWRLWGWEWKRCSQGCMTWRWRFQELRVACNFDNLEFRV